MKKSGLRGIDLLSCYMSDRILFTECQKFTQWWLWLILLGINGMFLSGAYLQIIEGNQFGDKPMSNEGILVTAGVSILLTILHQFSIGNAGEG